MTNQHGQISGIGSVNDFSHSCINNFSNTQQEVPLTPSATYSSHLISQQFMPMDNTCDRNNAVSVNYFEPSVGIPNTNRLEEGLPFGYFRPRMQYLTHMIQYLQIVTESVYFLQHPKLPKFPMVHFRKLILMTNGCYKLVPHLVSLWQSNI